MNTIVTFKGKQYVQKEQKNGNVLLVSYNNSVQALKDKLEWAKERLAELNDYDMAIRFAYIGQDTYALSYQYSESHGKFGKASCNSNDEYHIEIGQAIAFCRLVDEYIPDFIFE